MHSNRRQWLVSLLSAAAAARLGRSADGPVVIPGKRPMILHNDRPEDLETPVRYFDSWITPIDEFLRPPAPSAARRKSSPMPTSLTVERHGLQEPANPDARRICGSCPQYTVPATIECTGNGRAFFSPESPRHPVDARGAVGNAEWRGPRLVSDVLNLQPA